LYNPCTATFVAPLLRPMYSYFEELLKEETVQRSDDVDLIHVIQDALVNSKQRIQAQHVRLDESQVRLAGMIGSTVAIHTYLAKTNNARIPDKTVDLAEGPLAWHGLR
jgi:phosphate starvation-inducible protein PhoH